MFWEIIYLFIYFNFVLFCFVLLKLFLVEAYVTKSNMYDNLVVVDLESPS